MSERTLKDGEWIIVDSPSGEVYRIEAKGPVTVNLPETDKLIVRINTLTKENQRLREALQRNVYQARKVTYDGRNHHCDWRNVAEAMIQRSEQALEQKPEDS